MKVFWWIYFALLLCMCALGLVAHVLLLLIEQREISALSVLPTIVNVWGLVGFWGFLRSKRLGPQSLWIICFLATLLQLSMGGLILAWVLVEFGAGGQEGLVTVMGLAGVMVAIPWLVALQRYAFRSPHIWKRSSQNPD